MITMAAKVNLNKHIWEGWTVGAIHDDMRWDADNIQKGNSCRHKPFKTQKEIAEWFKNEYPNWKKAANDIAKLIGEDYGLPKDKSLERD